MREKINAEIFNEACSAFDQRSSGSTISIAGRTNDEIIILPFGFWLALDLTVQE